MQRSMYQTESGSGILEIVLSAENIKNQLHVLQLSLIWPYGLKNQIEITAPILSNSFSARFVCLIALWKTWNLIATCAILF